MHSFAPYARCLAPKGRQIIARGVSPWKAARFKMNSPNGATLGVAVFECRPVGAETPLRFALMERARMLDLSHRVFC